MATRMQQRRGTAQQWTDADPILAAGEIGFETDTNQFKIGDGVNAWSDLSYFKNLEDLGGSLDDYILLTQKGTAGGVAELDNTGKIPSSQIPALVGLDSEISAAVSAAVSDLVDGAPAALDTLNEIAEVIGDSGNIVGSLITNIGGLNDSIALHSSSSINVHGIADTANLATQTQAMGYANDAEDNAIGQSNTYTDDQIALSETNTLEAAALAADDKISDHNALTLNIHGIANTADLATQDYVDDAVSTSATSTLSTASDAASTALSGHASDTTGVHGITDTANLVYTADSRLSDERTPSAGSVTAAKIATDAVETAKIKDLNVTAGKLAADAVETAKIANSAVTEAKIADGAVSTAKIASGAVTKSMVGLGNVDNTSDANKPVSTATQTALDLKANLDAPTFTGTVTSTNDVVVNGNLTVNGTTFNASSTSITIEDNLVQLAHQNPANTVDLGLVVAYNDGANKHAGIARDVSDDKWKLFKGVTSEPTTTVNFAQGSLDNLAVAALEATTVTPSAGIVFSDGTQVKAGVPSITTFATAISSSATLATGEQDKFVPLTGAVTITLPATGYSTGQSIDFYQASGTGAQFASTNSVVGTPGLKFRTTNSVVTAMKTSSGWLVFGDLSA
jgi:hypothetical protein